MAPHHSVANTVPPTLMYTGMWVPGLPLHSFWMSLHALGWALHLPGGERMELWVVLSVESCPGEGCPSRIQGLVLRAHQGWLQG